MRHFSKLKKQIDSLFVPELDMEFCCISYPMKSQYGSTSIPRFYVKIGKEIIWDCPKDFKIIGEDIYWWVGDNRICELIRDYIDAPLDQLINLKFKNDHWSCNRNNYLKDIHETVEVDYGLTDIFKAADRRIGKKKLMEMAEQSTNKAVIQIIEKRLSVKSAHLV